MLFLFCYVLFVLILFLCVCFFLSLMKITVFLANLVFWV